MTREFTYKVYAAAANFLARRRQIRGLEMMMTNYNDLSLYLVVEGEVTPASADTHWDGVNSILVAATSKDGALKIASAYDNGLAQANNLAWDGSTIAVVTLRDPDTGLYS